MIKLLKAQDYIKMPWKNGVGITEEVIKVTDNNVDNFLWRVSIADIKEDGAFSSFTGYQRIISVLEGNGMVLEVDGKPSHPLSTFDPFAFKGESKVSCKLLKGALRDFNLIYNPRSVAAHLQWIVNEQPSRVFTSAEDMVLFNAGDKVTVSISNQEIVLEHYDTLWVTNQDDLKEVYITTITNSFKCCFISLSTKN